MVLLSPDNAACSPNSRCKGQEYGKIIIVDLTYCLRQNSDCSQIPKSWNKSVSQYKNRMIQTKYYYNFLYSYFIYRKKKKKARIINFRLLKAIVLTINIKATWQVSFLLY